MAKPTNTRTLALAVTLLLSAAAARPCQAAINPAQVQQFLQLVMMLFGGGANAQMFGTQGAGLGALNLGGATGNPAGNPAGNPFGSLTGGQTNGNNQAAADAFLAQFGLVRDQNRNIVLEPPPSANALNPSGTYGGRSGQSILDEYVRLGGQLNASLQPGYTPSGNTTAYPQNPAYNGTVGVPTGVAENALATPNNSGFIPQANASTGGLLGN